MRVLCSSTCYEHCSNIGTVGTGLLRLFHLEYVAPICTEVLFVVDVVDDAWCCRACDARAVGVAAVELCICDVIAALVMSSVCGRCH